MSKNTFRMNKLEELGRVDAEKAYTPKGKKNLMAEKKRVVGEIKRAKAGGVMKAMPSAKAMGSMNLKAGGSTAAKRADGVAKKGHTKGKMMRGGGMCK